MTTNDIIALIPERFPFPQFQIRRAQPTDKHTREHCCWIIMDCVDDEEYVRQSAINCMVHITYMGFKAVMLAMEPYEKVDPQFVTFLKGVRTAFAKHYFTKFEAPITHITDVAPSECAHLATFMRAFASISKDGYVPPVKHGKQDIAHIDARLREFMDALSAVVPFDISDLRVPSILEARFDGGKFSLTFRTTIGKRGEALGVKDGIRPNAV